MSSCPDLLADSKTFAQALIHAKRLGKEKILAFYDSRVELICKDPSLLLIPLDDHMCHRGDGLFESIAFRQKRFYALDEHLARLMGGAARLDLKLPCSNLRSLLCAVARAAEVDDGDMRIFLSRGPGGFGISPAECPESSLYIVALAQSAPDPRIFERGLSSFSSKIPPKQDYLARIKNTNYLPNVLMAKEALTKGRDIAISFNEKGEMGEAAIANAAIIDKSGTLVAPAFDGILAGTTLLAALRLAGEKMPVRQGPVTREDIAEAKEMLLFTSATLCVPVTSFDDRPIGAGVPGPVARWLKDELTAHMLATGTPFDC